MPPKLQNLDASSPSHFPTLEVLQIPRKLNPRPSRHPSPIPTFQMSSQVFIFFLHMTDPYSSGLTLPPCFLLTCTLCFSSGLWGCASSITPSLWLLLTSQPHTTTQLPPSYRSHISAGLDNPWLQFPYHSLTHVSQKELSSR